MSHAVLTAKYRPQTFAQVAGQDTLKAILSRASLERRVAPAYLFSGTRGVGKTTLARIFAKALNCRAAPTAEPCNVCDQCRAITAGNAVDVVEIDGASNRGIDDVRRLKEVVGYAPMEGAYKIFIIDEAHMLSREAFNALLKTLEEPPSHVTFIMATTEPHKFPATIISRCQHYVFKRLPESGLIAHLEDVLAREQVDHDESAVRLIARRGAGSVRDSMSLLGQVLALKEGKLTEESTRSVLGLAGQEAFLRMLEAFRTGDSLTLSRLLREMLDQGLDMGFFLRELSSLWRNLFMLRQSGAAALPVVDLPENEARACLDAASGFSLQHIHACWQMTLEGQRRVLTSLEPALALELLLLNLAMLPRLLSLEQLSAMGRRGGQAGGDSGGSVGQAGRPAPTASGSMAPVTESARSGNTHSADTAGRALPETPISDPPPVASGEDIPDEKDIQAAFSEPPRQEDSQENGPDWDDPSNSGIHTRSEDEREEAPRNGEPPVIAGAVAEGAEPEASRAEASSWEADPDALPRWDSIFPVCADMEAKPWLVSLLRKVEARFHQGRLILEAKDEFVAERLCDSQIRRELDDLLKAWCGGIPDLEIVAPDKPRKSREEIRAEVLAHPLVKEVEAHLGAYVIDYGQIRI